MSPDYRRLFDLRLGGRARVDAEMDLEIESHLAMRTADLVRAGMPPDEARREAERRFGDFTTARRRLHAAARQREASMANRDRWGSVAADLRYALRQAHRAPAFTALAVGMLAIGIGATTAIFTLVERVLLRPLPFPHAEQLVRLTGEDSAHNATPTISSADWLDWRGAPSLRSSAIYSVPLRQGILTSDSAVRVTLVRVSGTFFDVLGARFVAGRPFTERDATAPATAVVISERLWRANFNADPELRTPLRTGTGSFPVVGVVAGGQEFPARTDVWLPTQFTPRQGVARTILNWFAIARLQSGDDLARARTELSTIATRIHAAEPEAIYDFGVGVRPLGDAIVGDASAYLRMLMAAVALVLLIVCANVAAASLARATGRAREMAVRASLGAPRGRLVQQLLIEHLWLGLAGGAAGLFLAWAAVQLIVARWGGQIPRADEISLDGPVFLFAAIASFASGALAGVLPALRSARSPVLSVLAAGGRTTARGGRNIAGASLVSGEIALAVLLLTGAGLLIRSFRSVLSREIGFETNVATVEATLAGSRYNQDSVRRYVYWDGLVEALRRVPGVDAVGLSQWIPLGITGSGFIDVAGREMTSGGAVYRTVSQGFFRALRIPLMRGRTFSAEDGAGTPRVVVINNAMAATFWPGENPIGKQVRARSMELRPNGAAADWLTVIGVVGDVRTNGLETDPRPEMYVYFRQTPGWTSNMTALVHSSKTPESLAGDLHRAALSVDPNVAVDVASLRNLLRGTLAVRTLTMTLLSAFAGVALALAALGIYGVLSYAVSQRTRELAVRAALGASRGRLLMMMLIAGARVVVAGAAVGVLAAAWLTQALESMLVDVRAFDPLTFAAALGVLVVAAFAAILVPSVRATRLDPIIALHAE